MLPSSVKNIAPDAFSKCFDIWHVDLGACTLRSDNEENYLSDNIFRGSALETIVLPRTLRVIGESAFEGCKCLKSVSFSEDPMLDEIGVRAFYGYGLESFTVPQKLKKISAVAFGNCRALKDFWLNKEIREFGWLCFWATAIEDIEMPLQVAKTEEQLGLDQRDPKAFRLPDTKHEYYNRCVGTAARSTTNLKVTKRAFDSIIILY